MRCIIASAFLVVWGRTAVEGAVPDPIFYLPLDGSTRAAIAGGSDRARTRSAADPILTLLARERECFSPGKVGQCYDVGDTPLIFRAKGNFRPDEGTCSLWVQPRFRGDSTDIYCTFFGAEKWGMLYKYLKHTSLTFGTAKPERDLYYDCNVPSIAHWRSGDWHHVVVTWSRQADQRRAYVDGALEATGPFPHHRQFDDGPLFIGAGCELYPSHTAHSRLDEVAIWDRALDDTAVAELLAAGTAGRPIRAAAASDDALFPEAVTVAKPSIPCPENSDLEVARQGAREELRLDGWWHVLLAERTPGEFPADGWCALRVPGHHTRSGSLVGADGKPVGRTWSGRAVADWPVACYQRSFTVPPGWRGRPVMLHIGGADGLAQVLVNGSSVGLLGSWEDEDFLVNDLLRWGQENVVTIILHSPRPGTACGVYGSVLLRATPTPFIRDVAVRPKVGEQGISFSCDVWSGTAVAGRVELDIESAHDPGTVVKRFSGPCRLAAATGEGRGLYGLTQRLELSFEWPEARPWTYDAPELYTVRARVVVDGAQVDETPAQRFGYRELTIRGGDFLLNGVPTHLRGHQLNLAWSNQLQWIRDMKEAGMNCVEIAGPGRHTWDSAVPTNPGLFEQILDFADENGILTVPALPGAKELRERLLEPEVGALYRRRVDKHIRRYGNHASAAMWFMHFNLAGYRWYLAPMKVDGSYKPGDPQWRSKERYALEAQRIAQLVDPRPIFHHACGALGDIHTANCYLGPSFPLQERCEWPSRWAETRPHPLVTCEHGLWLVPYWYRPREFPLSNVYSDEPIFDELSAMMLGPRAYSMVTAELVDTYALPKDRARDRLKALVTDHPGYQEVKALIGKESLRAWRAYGVSGIIFNAIQWDFRTSEGEPSQVLRSLQRHFNHTDCFIAGPPGDWPSRVRAFYAGETVGKQLILLNDLTHDVGERLRLELKDEREAVVWGKDIEATSEAGRPTFVPFGFTAPDVPQRTAFTLSVVRERAGRPQDTVSLHVFPRYRPGPLEARVILHDTVGKTAAMLTRAGVVFERLSADSTLAADTLVVVGRESWGKTFTDLASAVDLGSAVVAGTGLLVFEQSALPDGGLQLRERSTRRAFVVWPENAVLEGLAEADFADLRGQSDMIEPYPDAAPETETQWPQRFHKWGNRGVLATHVLRIPHHGPFVPLLRCGFDLTESPLMEARIGKGRVVHCQVDVTGRYGTDPVSTRLVDNLLRHAASPPPARRPWRLLTLDEAKSAHGLETQPQRLFGGRLHPHPLLAGLTDGDLYAKEWFTCQVIREDSGWEIIAEPGLIAVKDDLVVCALDPAQHRGTRLGVKAQRLRSILAANAGQARTEASTSIPAPTGAYLDVPWESLPPYINW